MRIKNTSTADIRRRIFAAVDVMARDLVTRTNKPGGNRVNDITMKQARAQIAEALNRRCVTDVIEEQLDYQVNEEPQD